MLEARKPIIQANNKVILNKNQAKMTLSGIRKTQLRSPKTPLFNRLFNLIKRARNSQIIVAQIMQILIAI